MAQRPDYSDPEQDPWRFVEIPVLQQYHQDPNSLARKTRLYYDSEPWTEYKSIFSQVCLPEKFIYNCVSKIIPQAQKDFLSLSRKYWPRLYRYGFLDQWQCVNFGRKEQGEWRGLYKQRHGWAEPPSFEQEMHVSWNEFIVGLQMMTSVRNFSCHPKDLKNIGTVWHYDEILRMAQFFFITVQSQKGACLVMTQRELLRENATHAFERIHRTDLTPLITVPSTFVGFGVIPTVNKKPMDKSDPKYKTAVREMFIEQWHNFSIHDRRTVVYMNDWLTAWACHKEFRQKIPPQKEKDHHFAPKLNEIIKARSEMEAWFAEKKKKAKETAEAIYMDGIRKQNEEEMRRWKDLRDNHEAWIAEKEAQMEANYLEAIKREEEERNKPYEGPPFKEWINPDEPKHKGVDTPWGDDEEKAILGDGEPRTPVFTDDVVFSNQVETRFTQLLPHIQPSGQTEASHAQPSGQTEASHTRSSRQTRMSRNRLPGLGQTEISRSGNKRKASADESIGSSGAVERKIPVNRLGPKVMNLAQTEVSHTRPSSQAEVFYTQSSSPTEESYARLEESIESTRAVKKQKAVNRLESKVVNGVGAVEVSPRRNVLSRKSKGY